MTRIEQRAEQDCFLCCLAMALEFNYDQAAATLGAELAAKIGRVGLYGEDITTAFTLLGLGGDRARSIYAEVRDEGALAATAHARAVLKRLLWGRRAIVQVPSKNYPPPRQHVVYWNGEEMIDPSPLKTYTWDEVRPVYIWLLDEGHAALCGSLSPTRSASSRRKSPSANPGMKCSIAN